MSHKCGPITNIIVAKILQCCWIVEGDEKMLFLPWFDSSSAGAAVATLNCLKIRATIDDDGAENAISRISRRE